MSAQFSQPHLCGWRFSRSDGKGAVAAALVLSNLLQRTCGRGFRLERVRPLMIGLVQTRTPRGISVSADERGSDATVHIDEAGVGDRPLRN
jgi:hypothetical protein